MSAGRSQLLSGYRSLYVLLDDCQAYYLTFEQKSDLDVCRHRRLLPLQSEHEEQILTPGHPPLVAKGKEPGMDVLHACCAGLDVHKKTVMATVIISQERGKPLKATQTFGTMTEDLLIKAVPGRKTDVKDSEWIAELLRYGLIRASFVPPKGQRELRELTRIRSTFVKERATLVNRLHKVLESANIKLASVASYVNGISGKAILQAMIAGGSTPEQMAELAQGRLRGKRDLLSRSLQGYVKPHHRFILSELLLQIDGLDETIGRFDEQLREYCPPFEEAVVLLDTIPGVARKTAEVIVSEIGVDMTRFPTANHLASWDGVAPGNNESAGKRLSGKTTKGNQALISALAQAAHAASRVKNSYLHAQFHRLAGRRGKKKFIIAVAHSILIIAYHMIKNKEPYRELGSDFFDKCNVQATTRRMVRRLEQLGYKVNLESLVPIAA